MFCFIPRVDQFIAYAGTSKLPAISLLNLLLHKKPLIENLISICGCYRLWIPFCLFKTI